MTHYIVKYTQGTRLVTVMNPTRFWEARKFPTKEAAEAFVTKCKADPGTPDFVRFKVYKSSI